MIRIPLTFFCFISMVCRVSSQPGFSAVIVDVHRMPVQYALVRNLSAGGGAYSNEKGLFSVPVKSNNDSLRINHTGFKGTTIVAHPSADTIVLQESSRQLENINVYARQPKLVKMGSTRRSILSFSTCVSSIEHGRSFSFGMSQKHLLKTILIPYRNTDQEIGGRVNVYNVTNGYPQALLASQMVYFEQRDNRLDIMEVDMEPKQITVQRGDTLFVSFEFLGCLENGVYKNCTDCTNLLTFYYTKSSEKGVSFYRRRFFEETWHSFIDDENRHFWENRDLACSILLLPLGKHEKVLFPFCGLRNISKNPEWRTQLFWF